MFRYLRTHVAWKMFFSYLLVVLVGFIVLAAATRLSVPSAFERHMSGMMPGEETMMGGMMGNQTMQMDLFQNYQAAVNEALSLAVAAALIAAIFASFFISRQIVEPIQKMKAISHRIADGDYAERLAITGDGQLNQLDELDQLSHSFNQMADKLEQTEQMRRELIGDVTHELRTPLAAIKGYMEGLIDGVIPATPQTYQQVHAEADRLQRLVNDLQELSIVEGEAYQLNLVSIQPKSLIETIVNQFSYAFEEKGLQLTHVVQADLPDIFADTDRIQQVLTNLLGNALQYTPEGGKVELTVSENKSEMLFSIRDSGIGIPAEQLPLVFNRFYRIDKSRARLSGGSGIGLTIAKALVLAHHGRIWVESAGEAQGSTFSFALPISTKESQ
ncbi:MAG: HAMP domain-containing protein [Anaerolineaceae bacterium]|nr:HAMP domain-containing protein [Anaerolineaceae bacterium]